MLCFLLNNVIPGVMATSMGRTLGLPRFIASSLGMGSVVFFQVRLHTSYTHILIYTHLSHLDKITNIHILIHIHIPINVVSVIFFPYIYLYISIYIPIYIPIYVYRSSSDSSRIYSCSTKLSNGKTTTARLWLRSSTGAYV